MESDKSYDYEGAMQSEQYKTLVLVFPDMQSKEIVHALYETKGDVSVSTIIN